MPCHGTNPCSNIAKSPDKKPAWFLDTDELAQLGRAIEAHEARCPDAVVTIRLLAFTGCNSSEVLDLRWCNIYNTALNLED